MHRNRNQNEVACICSKNITITRNIIIICQINPSHFWHHVKLSSNIRKGNHSNPQPSVNLVQCSFLGDRHVVYGEVTLNSAHFCHVSRFQALKKFGFHTFTSLLHDNVEGVEERIEGRVERQNKDSHPNIHLGSYHNSMLAITRISKLYVMSYFWKYMSSNVSISLGARPEENWQNKSAAGCIIINYHHCRAASFEALSFEFEYNSYLHCNMDPQKNI